jgi:excisionase family DNA binding protein
LILPTQGPPQPPRTSSAAERSSWQIACAEGGSIPEVVDNPVRHPPRAACGRNGGRVQASCQTEDVPPRFYLLADIAEMLNVTTVQARALVQSGELPAIQVGGRGQWRIEATELEAYIQRKYAETKAKVEARRRSIAAGTPEDDL